MFPLACQLLWEVEAPVETLLGRKFSGDRFELRVGVGANGLNGRKANDRHWGNIKFPGMDFCIDPVFCLLQFEVVERPNAVARHRKLR